MNQNNLNFKIYLYLITFLNVIVSIILVRSVYLLTNNLIQNQKYNEIKNYLQTLSNTEEIFTLNEEKYQRIIGSFSELGNINSFLVSLSDATLQSGSRVIETKILESNNDYFIAEVTIIGKMDEIRVFTQRIEEDTKIKEIVNANFGVDKENITAKLSIKSYRNKND